MLGKIIKFIRVRGRVIPIRTKTTSKNFPSGPEHLLEFFKKENKVGFFRARSHPNQPKTAMIDSVKVKGGFRNKGFGIHINKRGAQFLRDKGYKKVVGFVENPKQLKIRQKHFRNTSFSRGEDTLKSATTKLRKKSVRHIRAESDLPRFTTTQKRGALVGTGAAGIGTYKFKNRGK